MVKEKDPYELIRDAEEHLDEFIEWQVDHGATNNFLEFAEYKGKAQDAFKYAAILYPRFILVEGAVVLLEHYHKENWEQWRERLTPFQAARIVNHVHVDFYFSSDAENVSALRNELGHLLVFFWQMAVNVQFPKANVRVQFDGNKVDIYQEDRI